MNHGRIHLFNYIHCVALTGQGQSITDTKLPKDVIPSDVGPNAIALYPDKYSRRDLDVFYRDMRRNSPSAASLYGRNFCKNTENGRSNKRFMSWK